MSFNQSRPERSESFQYRKSNRSGTSAQPRNLSGGIGKGGGGPAPPPSSTSTNSSLSSNRSFKKSNNAQGGQSRVSSVGVNPDPNYASAARTTQNGAHLRSSVHGVADAPLAGVPDKPTTDMPTQKSTQAIPKAPSSQPAIVNSDSTPPATPAKGEASKSFPLQFGSISPGFVNGMQIPARTNSAPPNLDEQQRDQVRHDSRRTAQPFPIPSVPKKQLPRKDGDAGDQSNTGEAHQMSKPKRDVQFSSASPITQTQKTSVHHIPGVSMPMPFHQPQVPVQHGGPKPPIQSQGMAATSLPVPMPMHMSMPLPMGNAQLQQSVFVPNLQPHPMQPQGIMHQGQSLNFPPQMGPHMPQLGNLGISIGAPFAQHQAGKYSVQRKPVKITHPDTHEELRLGGSSGTRSHPNVQQSQPIPSIPPGHSINYYSNSYNPNPLFFPAPSSVPLTSTQINPSSQAPRFSYPPSQSTQIPTFVNSSAHNSHSGKISAPSHGSSEPSSLEQPRGVHSATSSAPPTSVQVTIKQATGLNVEKIADSSQVASSASIEKGETPTVFQHPGEDSLLNLQSNPDASLQPKRTQEEPMTSSVTVAVKESTAASLSVDAPLEMSAPAVTNNTENKRQTISKSDSIKDQQKKQIKKGFSQPQHQVPGQSSSISNLSFQSSKHSNSFTSGNPEVIVTASSSDSGNILESARESLSTHSPAAADVPAFKTDSNQQGFTCESSETFGSSGIVGRLETDHHARQNDSSPQNESLKLELMGTKDSEAYKEDKYRPESLAKSVSTNAAELANQTEPNAGMKVTNNFHEVNREIPGKDSEEPLGQCTKDDVVADEFVIPTSLEPDDTNGKSSPSSNSDSKTSSLDVPYSRSDSLGSRQAVLTKSVPSDGGEAPVSAIPSVSEPILESEGEGTEYVNDGLVSLPAAASNDKPVVELSRSKSNVSRGKKKRKEFLQKADALGTTSDLYMAYKGPEEKNEIVASLNSITGTSSVTSKQELVDTMQDDIVLKKAGQHKSEPDDWEDAADFSTPRLEAVDDGKQVHNEDGNGLTKKYSRDFLLKFSEQCSELPEGLEITSDIAEALMSSNLNASREFHPSPARIVDRPSSVARLDRRGSGLGGDDRWNKLPGPLVSGQEPRMDGYGGNLRPGQVGNYGVLRNPRAQTPPQYVGGILSGPLQSLGSQGGIQRNTPDSDRWQRASSFQKGLIPSPQTPLQVMHKAEKKYELGKITDEEVAKQRRLKAILNKLTPQNFEKLFEQVKEVNIDNTVTLTGVISQIFDKALMEPTFCEMYANFCYYLAGELPDFSEDNEKITFKRLLLNKCQEEFERDAREQEEADRADDEGDVKLSEGEREEKRIQARRRMLGNIRLIGELYKKKMLTEKIMHECIKKLLGEYQNPDEENIEALCKLMSTIGEMIDHPKAKPFMDAYFDRMAKLSNNMNLSSRLRFMLKDSIDLRKNKWQQRRKVEGPKKIEEVHRDAAQERHVQAGRLARAPSINSRSRQPMDFSPRGSGMLSSPNMGSLRGLPPQPRGYGIQDARLEDRHPFENRVLSVPLPQRPTVEDSITLGPQGGLARGMSSRGQPSMPTSLNGYSPVSEKPVYSSREDLMPRYTTDRFGPSHDQLGIPDRNVNFGNRELRNADRSVDRSRPISPIINSRESRAQSISSDNMFPEERLRDMSIAAIKEFYSAKDEKEVATCVKELNAPTFYPTMISIWVTDSFERKDMERDLLAKLLIKLSTSQDAMLNGEHLIKGFESVLGTLEDAVNDAPKAGEFLGRIFAKIIIENVIPFTEIGQLIQEGGEVQGSLVEMGLAAEVVGTILETIKSEKGDSVLNEIRSSSSLKIEKFKPPNSKKPLRLDKFI